MKEYRVKGLSCGNCAEGLERQIRQLEHGKTARLSFNSGKIRIDPNVSIDLVKQILKSDGAYLAEDNKVNPHEPGNRTLLPLLILSGCLYAAGLLLEGSAPFPASIALYLFAIAISGYKTFIKGIRNLAAFNFTIDTLMTIALTGAVAIGEWKEATLVAFLFGINEVLEGKGMEQARRSMASLLDSTPKHATRINTDGSETVAPITTLDVGDIVVVRPGEQIPSDGTVRSGISSVNEAAITGESLPVDKRPGESVYGGSINNEGLLTVRIDRAYHNSSLARILHLVEEAQETKTPTELFINRFSKYYTPLIILIAALVMFIPPLILGGDWIFWLYQGLAVLIVGCPCALILASPIAIISGITRNARHGILIKGGAHLEQLGKLDVLAFDKTGTLTVGRPKVLESVVYDQTRFLAVAASVESTSSHPLAKAIVNELRNFELEVRPPDSVESVSGQGIIAVIDGVRYWVGNEAFVSHLNLDQATAWQIDKLKSRGLTLVLVADEKQLLGMFGLADEIRGESKKIVQSLHRLGIRKTVILSGDHQKTVDHVAAAVGVTDAFGKLLPDQKAAAIRELAETGRVAMVGDGMNDAPALATAQLGIAMGKGSDTAVETADVVLMQDHLGKLPQAITIAKRVNRIIRFNITFALALKLIALLLTIPGLLTLWIAILSDMGATIIVTLAGLTVLWSRN
ncbi:heavy metal translocating P-type ATPase [Paenibacillus tarimensis]